MILLRFSLGVGTGCGQASTSWIRLKRLVASIEVLSPFVGFTLLHRKPADYRALNKGNDPKCLSQNADLPSLMTVTICTWGLKSCYPRSQYANIYDPLSINVVARWKLKVRRALPLFICHQSGGPISPCLESSQPSSFTIPVPKLTSPTMTSMCKQRGTSAMIDWRAGTALSGCQASGQLTKSSTLSRFWPDRRSPPVATSCPPPSPFQPVHQRLPSSTLQFEMSQPCKSRSVS